MRLSFLKYKKNTESTNIKSETIKYISHDLKSLLTNLTLNKIGVEIGGPSSSGITIYENARNIDNIIFSANTIWSNHTTEYKYFRDKKGNVIINDAASGINVASGVYDFVFASHSLEHIANPIKALKEWLRITKPSSPIILILPERSMTFDHNRNITLFSTLLSQYEKNVGEDDLSTLDEILEKHDLSMDPPAGSFEQFKLRSLDNFNNRCLHHYVYSPELLKEICSYLNCEFIYTKTDGINIWFIMKS